MTVAFADANWDSVTCSLLLLPRSLLNLQVLQQSSVLLFTSSLCLVVFRHKQCVSQCILAFVPYWKNQKQFTPIKFQTIFQKAQGKTHAVPSDKKHSITYCLLYGNHSWLRVLDYCHCLKVTFQKQRSWKLQCWGAGRKCENKINKLSYFKEHFPHM